MNGATALPFVKTIRPPKIPIITRIGKSQNFLRALIKAQSSRASPSIFGSELVFHCIRRDTGRVALHPVARRVTVDPQIEKILAERPHNQTHRNDTEDKEKTHDDRVDDFV